MKVHCYLLCYNEEYIIESILKYYSSFCSKIFILDNCSTDRSVEIALSFPNVKVISWESDDKIDNKKYIKLKTGCYKDYSRKGGVHTEEVADWVIVGDMDEVLYHPDILSALAFYKSKGITVPQTTGFQITGENEVDPNSPLIEQYPMGMRDPLFDKRMVFDPEFDMSYSIGAHPNGPGFELMKYTAYGYSSSNEKPLALLHYKLIGSRWLETSKRYISRIPNKITKDTTGKYRGTSYHYQMLVDADPRAMKQVLNMGVPLFDDKKNIKFDSFPPTSGERGSDNMTYVKKIPFSEEDFLLLRNHAAKVEKDHMETSLKIMKILRRYRPDGEFINKKIQEYTQALKNG